MRRYLAPLIQGNKVKTTIKYHLVPVRMVITKKTGATSVREEEEEGHPCMLFMGM